jgi:hypothetical protein
LGASLVLLTATPPSFVYRISAGVDYFFRLPPPPEDFFAPPPELFFAPPRVPPEDFFAPPADFFDPPEDFFEPPEDFFAPPPDPPRELAAALRAVSATAFVALPAARAVVRAAFVAELAAPFA